MSFLVYCCGEFSTTFGYRFSVCNTAISSITNCSIHLSIIFDKTLCFQLSYVEAVCLIANIGNLGSLLGVDGWMMLGCILV